MDDTKQYAKYKIMDNAGIGQNIVTKDGHTMSFEDIVSDLNRKSYLEEHYYDKYRPKEATGITSMYVWFCPKCKETRGIDHNGRKDCRVCGKKIVAISVYTEHIKDLVQQPEDITCSYDGKCYYKSNQDKSEYDISKKIIDKVLREASGQPPKEQEQTEGLLPCPFCGTKAEYEETEYGENYETRWRVCCDEGHAIDHCYTSKKEAMEDWNTRINIKKQSEQPQEIEPIKLFDEWEKIHNPFYPTAMKYTRQDFYDFLKTLNTITGRETE